MAICFFICLFEYYEGLHCYIGEFLAESHPIQHQIMWVNSKLEAIPMAGCAVVCDFTHPQVLQVFHCFQSL